MSCIPSCRRQNNNAGRPCPAPGGTEAVVLYPDGHADVGLMVQGLDSLVEKARQYTR